MFLYGLSHHKVLIPIFVFVLPDSLVARHGFGRFELTAACVCLGVFRFSARNTDIALGAAEKKESVFWRNIVRQQV